MKENIDDKFVSILFPSSGLGEHDVGCFASFAIYFPSLNKRRSLKGGTEVGRKENRPRIKEREKEREVSAELRVPIA